MEPGLEGLWIFVNVMCCPCCADCFVRTPWLVAGRNCMEVSGNLWAHQHTSPLSNPFESPRIKTPRLEALWKRSLAIHDMYGFVSTGIAKRHWIGLNKIGGWRSWCLVYKGAQGKFWSHPVSQFGFWTAEHLAIPPPPNGLLWHASTGKWGFVRSASGTICHCFAINKRYGYWELVLAFDSTVHLGASALLACGFGSCCNLLAEKTFCKRAYYISGVVYNNFKHKASTDTAAQ